MLAPRKVGERKSDGGASGAGWRPSQAKNATSVAAPPSVVRTTTGEVNPTVLDSTRPKTIAPSPSVQRIAPVQSNGPLRSASRLSGTWRIVMASVTAASGTLMKKIQRQLAAWTSQPPSTGPNAEVIVVKEDQVPIAWPRRVSSK